MTPVVLLAIVAGGLQIGQTPYYEHLYAQARSHTPIVTDPMTYDTGYWPVGQTAAFYDGSYRVFLGDTFYATYELAPKLYDNALIEVDARSSMTSEYGSDVGFMLQGQHAFADQQALIAPGSERATRIALLIQGSRFTFFINGRYEEAFNDATYDGASFGLYAQGSDASFSNFAVYPLN